LINSVNELGYELDNQYYDIQGAYGYNGIISSSDSEEFILSFYSAFDYYLLKNNIIAEFTRFHPLLNNHRFSEKYMDVFFDRKTVYIDLFDNYENIFKNFQTTTKKQIKRCNHKYNLNIEIFEKNTSQLEIYYSIYKEAMDRVKSIDYLYFNLEYFHRLILNTNSVLFITRFEGKPIAAIIAFYNKHYIHGHLGGALTDYLFTSSYSLLYSQMIKYGIEKGCKFFHAGGGATSNIDDKLLQFKLNFSESTADFYIGKKIHNYKVYNEVLNQWGIKYPEKVEKFKNHILKYRY
jgi:lipid II:glycine glycyltransferase (peptidoglycan interpeptide bridge formation enzyme)